MLTWLTMIRGQCCLNAKHFWIVLVLAVLSRLLPMPCMVQIRPRFRDVPNLKDLLRIEGGLKGVKDYARKE